MSSEALYEQLKAAGLTVRQYSSWETRGGAWQGGRPVGVMEHHTALPVPYPVDRLAGSLIKCNMNTKPDGTVWLVAFEACNYSSGAGSSVVLADVRAGRAPTENARERNLSDDTNGNPYFWNFENDHPGDGSKMPDVQLDAIVTATRVVVDYFELTASRVISHAEWTRRKRDPYWNGDMRAIETIRSKVARAQGGLIMLPIEYGDTSEDVTLLEELMNDTFGADIPIWDPTRGTNVYDDVTKAAVKKYLGSYTNHPHWKKGDGVGGRQFAALLSLHAQKVGSGGGVSEARVKQLIESARLRI